MSLRGIRGATSVEADQPELIISATRELLESIAQSNPGLQTTNIASAIFTTTEDLVTVHPALGARQMGWDQVPMLCAREIPVPGSLPRCIRVLIHWNTDIEQEQVRHVYLHEAVKLRPDLCK
jgi:chorismate mutase